MNKDVFGEHGDFITSPEISQIFGELIGVWCLNEWIRQGNGCDVQIIELGPGRGSLAEDVIRSWSQFKNTQGKVSLHLVEVSDTLTKMQKDKLCGSDCVPQQSHTGQTHYRTKYGIPVSWHKHISQVPNAFSLFICQEFFDALPIHKFQFKDGGWHEVCVNYDPETQRFLYILKKVPVLWKDILIKNSAKNGRVHLEISTEAGILSENLAHRIKLNGGATIISDYGHYGDKSDTFRGFKNHKLHDPLIDPGTADMTADVDFLFLHDTISSIVNTHGPVSQASFLMEMGIAMRLKTLLAKATQSQQQHLLSGFRYLTDHAFMGTRFKFFAMTPKQSSPYTPPGFNTQIKTDIEQNS